MNSYYADSHYLSEGHDRTGLRDGRAAGMLGPSGDIEMPSLDRLCDSLDPRSGEPRTRIATGKFVGLSLFTRPLNPSNTCVLCSSNVDSLLQFRQIVEDFVKARRFTQIHVSHQLIITPQCRSAFGGRHKSKRTGCGQIIICP